MIVQILNMIQCHSTINSIVIAIRCAGPGGASLGGAFFIVPQPVTLQPNRMATEPSKHQMEGDDAAIVQQVLSGDVDAFRSLVERHSRRVFAMAYRMTGNENDADDIVQDAFTKAYRQLNKFESRANFGTWLYRIAANCALDHLRSRKVRDEVDQPLDDRGTSVLDVIPATRESPDVHVQGREIREQITAALGQLTVAERAAFVMRHFDDMPIREVGAALKLKDNATKNTIFRAVQKLRKALEPALGDSR